MTFVSPFFNMQYTHAYLGDFTNKTMEACGPGEAHGIFLMAYSNNIGIDTTAPTVITRNTISNLRGGNSGTFYSTWTVQQNSAGSAHAVYAWDYYVDITYPNFKLLHQNNLNFVWASPPLFFLFLFFSLDT